MASDNNDQYSKLVQSEALSRVSDEPISQVLRADIKAVKDEQADPDQIIEPILQTLELKIYKHSAWIMALCVAIAYLIGISLMPDVPIEYFVSVHLAVLVFMIWYALKYFATRIWLQFDFMRYFDVLYQVTMTSMFLLLSLKALPATALLWKVAPLFYLIIVLISSVTARANLCLFAGVLAALEYSFLAFIGIPDWVSVLIYSGFYITIGAVIAAIAMTRNRMLANVVNFWRLQAKNSTVKTEMEHAAEIQEKLIPPKSPDMDKLDAASFYLPCREVGGDYFDFVKRPNGHWLFALGDVSGKGIAAAMIMSNIQAIVRILATQTLPIESIADELNQAVIRASARGRFVTLVLIEFDYENKQLSYVNCGHNAPLLKLADNNEVTALEPNAPVLGIAPNLEYAAESAALPNNATLFAYTDGLSELRNKEGVMFEEQPIIDLIRRANEYGSAQELKDAMLRRVRRHLGRAEPNDDLSFVCINS